MKNSPYFDTLSETISAIAGYAVDAQLALSEPEAVQELGRDPLPYGAVRRGDFELSSRNGKGTRAWFHAVITRLDSGRYELVTYVL